MFDHEFIDPFIRLDSGKVGGRFLLSCIQIAVNSLLIIFSMKKTIVCANLTAITSDSRGFMRHFTNLKGDTNRLTCLTCKLVFIQKRSVTVRDKKSIFG
jgi:hypothetical protein